jgi:hypothetical protein
MHKFQLETVDGKPLGAVELARPDWPVGSIIYRTPNLRVVGHAERDGETVLVVEAV